MEKQLKSKLLKRQRIYAFVGKKKFAQDAYAKKISKAKKEYSEVFADCLKKIQSESDHSINTLSILKWWKLHETGDLTNMLKVKRDIDKMEANALNLLYGGLREEFFKEFGFNEEINKENQLKLDIVNLSCDMIIEDDIGLLTDIDILVEELKELQKKNVAAKASLLEVATNVKKIAGVSFDINTCTVGEFFTYINMIRKNG